MKKKKWRALGRVALLAPLLGLAACDSTGGFSDSGDQVFAPGVDLRAEAQNEGEDPVKVGHRLIEAGEYELAIQSFNRAALNRGRLDAEILSGLGTANLGLGRLQQAEILLRRATSETDAQPMDFNNLGVVLIEQGKTAEAVNVFRRAFALSNGESIAIRDNLRLALAKFENSVTTEPQDISEYKLVRRGKSEFVIQATP
jgi:Flp pilus assembly protein TadD